MGRPITIAEETILSAARELFLKRGLRATIVDIAAHAGVSPGIIFKRYATKESLFAAAMEVRADAEQALPMDLVARVGKGRVQDTLIELGTLLVDKFFSIVPLEMMVWSNPQDAPASRELRRSPERAASGMRMVADYLAKEAELGRVRRNDSEVVAAMFIGALWHYAFTHVSLGNVRRRPMSRQVFVRSVVDSLWSGIASTRRSVGSR
jgi:AcrR family transcriptional regulator